MSVPSYVARRVKKNHTHFMRGWLGLQEIFYHICGIIFGQHVMKFIEYVKKWMLPEKPKRSHAQLILMGSKHSRSVFVIFHWLDCHLYASIMYLNFSWLHALATQLRQALLFVSNKDDLWTCCKAFARYSILTITDRCSHQAKYKYAVSHSTQVS